MSTLDFREYDDTADRVCARCGDARSESGYSVPLCRACRDEMVRYPFPSWMVAAFIVVVAAGLFAGMRLPQSLSSAVAFARGETAEKNGDLEAAIRCYRQSLEFADRSTKIRVRLCVSLAKLGDKQGALAELQTLSGKKLTTKSAAEIRAVLGPVF